MAEEKLLTVRDVSLILGISEKEVVDLAESAALPAYKVGGVYLRFKKEQVEEFKKHRRPFSPQPETSKQDLSFTPPFLQCRECFGQERAGFKDKVNDFFYFNDFYILAILIIILLLVIIFQGY